MTRLAWCAGLVWALTGFGCAQVAAVAPVEAAAPVRAGGLGLEIEGMLRDPAVARDHWGIAVVGMDGAPIYSLNEGQLFQPASNAKLFTTAAALALLGGGRRFETKVVGRGMFTGPTELKGDVVLVGDGDANVSGRAIPYIEPKDRPKPVEGVPVVEVDPLRYLEAMADEVAATGLKRVDGDVVGDDTLFPWEPYASDWTIEDAVWSEGAPVSALTINDNRVRLTVLPGRAVGAAATWEMQPAMPYYTVQMEVTTGPTKSESVVRVERAMGSNVVRVYGVIAADGLADVSALAIADPAEYAAMALKGMLEARGIVVTGVARAKHRISNDTNAFLKEAREPMVGFGAVGKAARGQGDSFRSGCVDYCDPKTLPAERALASHRSPTLLEDLVVANKVSQNLHAELMLHDLGAAVGEDGSIAQGARVVRQFMLNAGIDGDDFVLFDGSGLSAHDLVTPRAVVRLLEYARGQAWFGDWKGSLPVGGVDGSLEGRFADAALQGKVFAKTGTLGEARALSGYVECASGKMVAFSILVGNHLPGTRADRKVMDRIVGAIAAAN